MLKMLASIDEFEGPQLAARCALWAVLALVLAVLPLLRPFCAAFGGMPPRTNPIEFQIVRAALAGDFALANSWCTNHGAELLRIAKSNKLLENKPQLAEQAIALLLRQRCDRPASTSKLFLLCQPFGAATLDVPLLEESTRVTGQSRVIQTASLSHSDVSLNKAAEPVLARCAADTYELTSNHLLTDPNVGDFHIKAFVMKAEYYTLDWHTPPAGTGYTVQDVASKWCLADGELLLDGKRRRMELTGANGVVAAYETETHSVVPGDPRKTKFKLKKLPEGMMQGQRGVIKRFANLDKQGAMVMVFTMCPKDAVQRVFVDGSQPDDHHVTTQHLQQLLAGWGLAAAPTPWPQQQQQQQLPASTAALEPLQAGQMLPAGGGGGQVADPIATLLQHMLQSQVQPAALQDLLRMGPGMLGPQPLGQQAEPQPLPPPQLQQTSQQQQQQPQQPQECEWKLELDRVESEADDAINMLAEGLDEHTEQLDQLNGRLDEISVKVEVLRLQAGPPVISYNPHVFTDHVEMETSGEVGLRGIETVAGQPQPPCLPSKRSRTEVAGDANFGAALLPAHGAAMPFATAPGTAAGTAARAATESGTSAAGSAVPAQSLQLSLSDRESLKRHIHAVLLSNNVGRDSREITRMLGEAVQVQSAATGVRVVKLVNNILYALEKEGKSRREGLKQDTEKPLWLRRSAGCIIQCRANSNVFTDQSSMIRRRFRAVDGLLSLCVPAALDAAICKLEHGSMRWMGSAAVSTPPTLPPSLPPLPPWASAGTHISQACTPPSSWYTRPSVLEREELAVFQNSWLAVAHASRLASRGRFISGSLLRLQWLACRGEDGTLHAFHNVCRHHAAILAEGHGTAACFTCRYHGWTYGLDGRLLKATRLKGIQVFKASEHGLLPLSVQEWGGHIWVRQRQAALSQPRQKEQQQHRQRVAEGGQHVEAWLGAAGSAAALAAGIGDKHLVHVASRQYELACNWKVFVDNYLDGGYHVGVAHPELASGLDLSTYRSTTYERISMQTCQPSAAGAGTGTDTAAASGMAVRLQEGARAAADTDQASQHSHAQRLASGRSPAYVFVYPNLMINRYGPWLDTNTVVPLAADRCKVLFEYYLEESMAGDASFVEASLAASHRVQLEDVALCESVQRGLASAGYDAGRYAPGVEQPMHHFHSLLHADLTAGD
ncbi:Choline monooxygenase [Chlorella vulgaris]